MHFDPKLHTRVQWPIRDSYRKSLKILYLSEHIGDTYTHTHSPQEQYQFCYDAAVDYLHSSDLLAVHAQKLIRTPSTKGRNSRGSSPARSESFTTKRSSRNLDLQMGNGASHIYGESDATSTFGTQRSSVSPRGSTMSGAQLLPASQGGADEIRLQTVSHVESRTGES